MSERDTAADIEDREFSESKAGTDSSLGTFLSSYKHTKVIILPKMFPVITLVCK